MSEKQPAVNADQTTLDGAEQHTVDEKAIVTKVDAVDAAQDETARATLGLNAGQSKSLFESLGFVQDNTWSWSEIAGTSAAAAFAIYILSFIVRKKALRVKAE